MRTDYIFLEEMRQAGDTEADAFVAKLFAQGQAKSLYAALKASPEELRNDDAFLLTRNFLLSRRAIPAWLDENRLLSGQQFFRKHALDIMTLLGALSLPFCYAASPGNKAILFTEKMRNAPGKRLLDTAQFIIAVLKEGSFADGTVYLETQRTRLIHAVVRYHIMKSNRWDLQWGVPVNQEDMAGTNLAFSFVIIRGLEESKVRMTMREKEDFLHAWRFIGYLLQIDEALLPASLEDAAQLERTIRKRHFRSSPESRTLMRDLIGHYQESFPAVAAYFVESQIRYLTGPEVADLLGIPRKPVRDRIVMGINAVRKKLNRFVHNPFSYQIMLRNHLQLRKRYTSDVH
jgi:Uncharacterized protein conserved in bacteria (DUF2236).